MKLPNLIFLGEWSTVVIPVTPKPEPSTFDQQVRKPGNNYLATVTTGQPVTWTNRDYWVRSLPHLLQAYGRICAYCATWIPPDVGQASVDHFRPKSNPTYQHLVYEWHNFRLASGRFNSRKSDYEDVVDPFTIAPESFVLDFPSLLIKAGPALDGVPKPNADSTIERLKLNDEICMSARQDWLEGFRDHVYPFQHLQRKAPFLAFELQRQGLDDAQLLRKRFKLPRWGLIGTRDDRDNAFVP